MPQRQYSQEAVMDEHTVERVGIIGAGMIGGTLGSIWRAAGWSSPAWTGSPAGGWS